MADVKINFSVKGSDSVESAFDRVGKAAKTAGDAVNSGLTFDAAVGRWRSASGAFASTAEMMAAGVESASAKAKVNAGNHFNGLAEIATGALRRIGEVAINALGAAAGALADFGAGSVTAAADFESTLNVFQSVAGGAMDTAGMKVDQFSDLFLEMGAKTKYSAGEAAQAAVELAKGGIDPATIAAGGLEAALGLAAAGALELSTAAGITAKQLGVWGDTGVTAAQVADLMAQAANASTVNVDELAMGMANVGGVAKVAGASFQDTVQAMALLAPGFSSASDAGTSLKTFLSRMIPASDDAAEAMLGLGLATVRTFEDGSSEITSKFFDAEGKFIGMGAAADLLNKSLSGLDEAQKLEALGEIFGQDAIRAAAMLGEAGAEGFDAMGESMLAAGTAAEQSAKMNQGWNFAMESLMGSLETIQIVIGSALLPTITSFVNDAVIPAVNSFLEWAQVATPAILGGLQSIANSFSYLFGVLASGDIAGILEEFNPLEFIAQAFGVELPASIQVLDDAFGNLVAAIMGDAGTSQAIVESFVAGVSERLQFMANFFSTVVIPAVAALVNFVAANWPTIQAVVLTVMNTINQVISTVLTGIQAFWATWGDEISALAQRAFDNVQLFFSVFTAAFEGDWRKVGETLRVIWDGLWASIQEITNNAISWFTSQDWGAIGTNIMQGIAAGINAGAQWIMDAALKAVQAAVEVVKGFLGIQSPSKVFAGIGANMMQGMGGGIRANAADPVRASANAAQAAAGAAYYYGGVTINTVPNATALQLKQLLDQTAGRADNRQRLA